MNFTDAKRERYKRRIQESIAANNNGCWIWQKSVSRNGYGVFALGGGKSARAHRVSYAIARGPIPPGMDVCHTCDVRSCVNPAHLFIGTRAENILDASRKNRVSRTHQKKGSAHPSAKLTEFDIPEIRRRLAAREPKTRIARDFGVSDRVILLIARGQLWKHVAAKVAAA